MNGETYAGPRPGDRITAREEVGALPAGSVLVRPDNGRDRWQKGDAFGNYDPEYGWYNLRSAATIGETGIADYAIRHKMIVESVPGDVGETFIQWLARFRDTLLYSAEFGLGATSEAEELMSELSVKFRPSVGMRLISRHERDSLPVGSVIYSGDPADYPTFAVWRRIEGRHGQPVWTRVLGGYTEDPVSATGVYVDQLPDTSEPAEWFTRTPSAKDAERIAKFRGKAWEAAVRHKYDHSWCSEFERGVIRAGLSEAAMFLPYLNGFQIGQTVTPEQAATLATGVILTTETTGDSVAVFERTARARNVARTKQVVGWNFEGQYADRMVIQAVSKDSFGQTGMGLRCVSVALMRAVPDGSVIGSDRNTLFCKGERGWGRLLNFGQPDEQAARSTSWHGPEAFHPGRQCGYWFFRFGPREEKG